MTNQELFFKNNYKDKDQELFFKYNYQNTDRCKKNDELTKKLYNGEIQWEKDKEREKLLILLHGSYACNLKCIYCENQHLRSEYVGTTIKEDIVRQVVQKLGSHIREVTWHGGEPLLLSEDLLVALEEEKKKYNLNFVTTLQTNSLLLSKEKLKFLDNLGIEFGTSFDGLDNNDSRGEASTKSILRCIDEFPGRIGFISVTHSKTINKLIENYEYFKSLGVTRVQSAIVRENVIENDNPYLIDNDIAVEKVIEYLEYWMHDTNNPIHDSYLERFIKKTLAKSHTCEDVYCLNGWVIVDPLGNITLCGHCGVEDKICNIKDIKNYYDFYYHPKYMEKLYRQKKLANKCKESCKWYYSCYGGCMGLNYEYKKDYSEVSPRNCEYDLKILEKIYDLIKDIDITDTGKYNRHFLELLSRNKYYSLTEIKKIESEMENNG